MDSVCCGEAWELRPSNQCQLNEWLDIILRTKSLVLSNSSRKVVTSRLSRLLNDRRSRRPSIPCSKILFDVKEFLGEASTSIPTALQKQESSASYQPSSSSQETSMEVDDDASEKKRFWTWGSNGDDSGLNNVTMQCFG